MKAVFIAYNQAHVDDVQTALKRSGIRGFTRWEEVQGEESRGGEPHLGTHAWPGKNMSTMVIIDDMKVEELLSRLKELDKSAEMMGLRAFVWNIEECI
ncbi:MAG: hypothetical protein LUG18_08235 [Candidatus Azobacteroides sp.]|nr:hypothetical protein [Candidatus Azobacteroides sp.]